MRRCQPPTTMPSPDRQRIGESKQHDVNEGACGYAPQCGCRALRRVNVCYASKGPQHDLVRCSANLTAGKRVPELMKCDNEKQCQILGYVPSDRRITASARTDFIRGHNKPRPVQKDINSSETKQMERTL